MWVDVLGRILLDSMITKLEERIYNCHLATSRKAQNKPFTLRKKFEDLDEEKVILLNKLSRFFISYPNVDIDDYFMAPHKIYPDETKYPLEFFITQKAKKAYAQYIKSLEVEDADNPESLKRLAESFKFLYKFCVENQLTFDTYSSYIEGNLPCWTTHLKDHKINFYTLHSLGFKINIETTILDFMFGDFYSTYQKTKNKFYTSKKMKEFAKQAKHKINKKL